MAGDSLNLTEFLAGYLAEVDEHLGASNRNILAVEENRRQGKAHPRAVRELFRSLHTIKGLSGMVAAEPVVGLAHVMEALLRAADRAGGNLGADAIEGIVQGLRAIETRVRALGEGKPIPPAPPALIQRLQGLELPSDQPGRARSVSLALEEPLLDKLTAADREQLQLGVEGGRRALKVDFIPSPARAAEGLTISAVRERLAKLAEIVKVIPRSATASAEIPGGLLFTLLLLTASSDQEIAAAAATTPELVVTLASPPAPSAAAGEIEPLDEDLESTASFRRGVVRVDVQRLDDALEKLSALVVTRFRLGRALNELRAQGADVRPLALIVHENARQLRDLRASIMRARMISVDEVLERIPLLVRGLAASTGKAVRLEMDGGRAELDKAVAERLFPAIVHLVRNAIDHALEPAAEREAAGKPREGLVRVSCIERSGAELELTISDDGRGIDGAKVARLLGKPAPEDDAALLTMLLVPGFSTLQQATTTSGRGMGMDIVKRIAVDQLGGDLRMTTVPGKGTTFALRVPLSITILDAFSFRCSSQPFVVPVASVQEIIEVDPARLISGPVSPGRRRGEVKLLDRRGSAVPIVSLDRLLELPPSPPGWRKGIVVRRDNSPFAFEVDQMLGQQEVVVRPIDDPLVRVPGISGSTDLGDGRPTLVLDLVALSGSISGGRRRALA